jgi:ABC-type multidrug transport system permease subunit
MIRWRALTQLFLARLREFYREPMVIFWVYGFPIFLAVALGIAFSGGLPWAPMSAGDGGVAVAADGDPGDAAALCHVLEAQGLGVELESEEAARERLRAGHIALLIVPGPQGYEYYFDPERPDSRAIRYRADAVIQRWHAGSSAWPTTDHPIVKPGDRYIDFLIPGLMGFNILTGGLWGVGYVVVDLRVRRLLRRFLATPMRPGDFLLAIVGSRLVFLIPEMLVLGLVGHFGFGTPVRGSIGTLAVVVLAGGAAFAGLGLLLACRTERAETVSGLINVLALPLWMFSGTFFSVERYPQALQPLIRASPLSHLNLALREVMLDGASLTAVSGHVGILLVWAAIAFWLALRWFRWR